MNTEANPEPIDQEPKPFNSVAYWLLSIGILLIVSFLAALSAPMVISSHKNPDRTEAINNAKQIGIDLFAFQEEYGTYPNDETAKDFIKKHPTEIKLSGTSSNSIFRQLFAAKIVDNEAMFYAKSLGASRPDNDISSGHLLEKGEVAFAYIALLSTENNPSLPIAFGPVIPGTTKFDPKPFDRMGIVLRIDGSVSALSINKNGEAMIGRGESLLDPNNKLWNGKAPDIRYPE
jgi:hypothetical protein